MFCAINFFFKLVVFKVCKHKHLNIDTLIIDTGMPLVVCAGCWLVLTV